MTSLNLKSLIKKLNSTCQHSLEAAAGLCLSRSHYNIEIEHWLLKLLEVKDNDLNLILSYYDIDTDRLINDLNNNLENLKTGNAQAPVLSQRTIDLVREAWVFSTLEYHCHQIRSGHLLYALLQAESLYRLALAISKQFTKVSVETLRLTLSELITSSIETTTLTPSLTTSVATPILNQFTINLTEQAQQGKIDPVIGRDTEIQQMIDILMRRRQNNPILTGEPGVGKTAVVEGLALRIAQGNVPSSLQNVAIYILDLGLLQAGAGIKGEFENRLKSVINEVKASSYPIILFIDEAHTLIGAGAQAGQGDAANLLKPALARGELRTIAATTWAEYKKYFEQDAALTRRFQVIKVEEPNEETAIIMLQGLAQTLETHHQVNILEEACVAAVHLSKRYLSERQLPDKAISVLDTACARLAMQISLTKNKIESRDVDVQAIAEVIANWTGIPLGNMLRDDIHTTLNLEKNLQHRIIGQPYALKIITQNLQIARAQLTDPRKPRGIFLLVGPSGVGKTETALALAEQLYGGEKKLTIINLSEFKEAHKVSLLVGSPPGYIGYGEGGILTEAVRRKPYSLILLDEIEKAHVGVQDVFYQVFDKGMLRDGQGRDVDFKNTVIILTSNVGSDLITHLCSNLKKLPSASRIVEILRIELLKVFKPAFLGRVTIVPYLLLQDEVMQNIINLQLQRIQNQLSQQYQTEFSYNEKVVKQILERCREVESGARHIEQVLSHNVLPTLSTELLSATLDGKVMNKICIDINKTGKFIYEFG